MNSNPQRGCGTKANDAFYLEGNVDEDGPLWAWTWVLGDGLDHNLCVSKQQVPPRSVVSINPVATLVKEQFVGNDVAVVALEPGEDEGYEYFLTKTRDLGLADYVGSQYYTAASFAAETARLGPSRRVNKDMAKKCAEVFELAGPFPMWFAHARVPLFEGTRHADAVRTRANEFKDAYAFPGVTNPHKQWLKACWRYDEWGQYAIKNQDPGNNHYLVPILRALDYLDSRQPKLIRGDWEKLDELFSDVHFEPQIFGASWMTRVTYTLPKENKDEAATKVLDEIPGIDILDLEEQVD